MTAHSSQKKGPASAPTLPGHGSTNAQKDMEMNKHVNSTAPAGAASVERISPALSAVYRSGAETIDAQLTELVDQFKRDAMAIDPTITGLWMGKDLTFDDRPHGAVQSVFLERDHAPFAQRRRLGDA